MTARALFENVSGIFFISENLLPLSKPCLLYTSLFGCVISRTPVGADIEKGKMTQLFHAVFGKTANCVK